MVIFVSLVWGQSGGSFEAVSIRRNTGVNGNTNIRVSGGRLTIVNGSVKTLIRNAYGLLSFQLANEPRWLDTEMYDIVATTGSAGEITQEGLKDLLRSLLVERFGLKVHWETREVPAYLLVVAKDGPKIHGSASADSPGVNTRKGPGAARMKGTHRSTAVLASELGNQLGRIVVDRTGLKGEYDWLLEWNWDAAQDSTYPLIFAAVQEQLGLKLEAGKGPMETLVIDRVEKATEN